MLWKLIVIPMDWVSTHVVYIWEHICVYNVTLCVNVGVGVCVCVCMCAYVCMCVCACVCVYTCATVLPTLVGSGSK